MGGSAATAAFCPKAAANAAVPEGAKAVGIGNCMVNSWEAAWALAKAGILINSAVITCGGMDDAGQCQFDALGVLSSVVTTAHFVLGAVNDCRYGFSYPAACAQMIMKVVGSIADMTSNAMAVTQACASDDSAATTRRLMDTPLDARALAYLAKLNMTEDELRTNPRRAMLAMKNARMTVRVNASADPLLV